MKIQDVIRGKRKGILKIKNTTSKVFFIFVSFYSLQRRETDAYLTVDIKKLMKRQLFGGVKIRYYCKDQMWIDIRQF